ncbi:MAG TPA: glycosyl hydrolase family 18 protein [Patescibacteria group bacterium]|nr:glycosyl hydrolase family 18 protein [Patescibacteria group bacterium]
MSTPFLLTITITIIILISTRATSFYPQKKILQAPTPTTSSKTYTPLSTSLFIPYWHIDKKQTVFTPPSIPALEMVKAPRIIYFGVTVNSHGIDMTESGYKNIIHIPPDQKDSLLVLRMTSATALETMLSDEKLFQTVAESVIHITNTYNYQGILLDLEIQSIPTNKTVAHITSFVQRLANELKTDKLSFSMTLFGDQFYRYRPYDLEALEKSVDHFYIMAYDLHKANGEPGPNFPLRKDATSDYDLVRAIDQFTTIIPPEKMTVVFGMYGYDWIVDEKKRPIKKATSLTLAQIKKKFLKKCSWENCIIRRDSASEETEMNYVEPPSTYHIVWFEDEQSVDKKIHALLQKGIVHYAFWAWGYY